MRVLDLLKHSTRYLDQYGIEDPHVEAERILLHAAGIGRLAAYRDDPEVDQRTMSYLSDCLARRSRGEPLQYIIGAVDFCGLRIGVRRGVLIPRPETELLVEEAVQVLRALLHHGESRKVRGPLSILDLCTGSGCIALALAQEFPAARVIGTDISDAAVATARENARAHGLENTTFLQGSLFGPVGESTDFDLIISNPPYVRTSEIASLQREVRDWEPHEALDGGEDGLDCYRTILPTAGHYLRPDGWVLLEIGYDQPGAVADVARAAGFPLVETLKDYAGIERILKAGRTGS